MDFSILKYFLFCSGKSFNDLTVNGTDSSLFGPFNEVPNLLDVVPNRVELFGAGKAFKDAVNKRK